MFYFFKFTNGIPKPQEPKTHKELLRFIHAALNGELVGVEADSAPEALAKAFDSQTIQPNEKINTYLHKLTVYVKEVDRAEAWKRKHAGSKERKQYTKEVRSK